MSGTVTYRMKEVYGERSSVGLCASILISISTSVLKNTLHKLKQLFALRRTGGNLENPIAVTKAKLRGP